jgi:hypothetical protein
MVSLEYMRFSNITPCSFQNAHFKVTLDEPAFLCKFQRLFTRLQADGYVTSECLNLTNMTFEIRTVDPARRITKASVVSKLLCLY